MVDKTIDIFFLSYEESVWSPTTDESSGMVAHMFKSEHINIRIFVFLQKKLSELRHKSYLLAFVSTTPN